MRISYAMRRMRARGVRIGGLYSSAGCMGGMVATEKTERVALFDNVKGILMILVVFGHIMHPVHNTNPALSTCFDIIYLFHMPLFVLVSGLFAKGAYRGGKLNANRIISFVVLGFAYQLALALINGATLTPQRICAFTSAPWYLIAMACWYGFTPVLAKLGARRGMGLALLAAFAGGLIDLSSGFLAISRTLAFLPWFALGYYLTPDALEKLRDSKWASIAVVAAAAIALARVFNVHAYDWFFQMVYGDNPYELGSLIAGALAGAGTPPELPASALLLAEGIAQKLTSLAVGAVFSLAALRLAPAGRSWLTTLGQRTLQAYVLHRLIRA